MLETKILRVGIGRRRYSVYIPDRIPKEQWQNLPVVYMFHGFAIQNSNNFPEVTDFNAIADELGFVLVYCQGSYPNNWRTINSGADNVDIHYFRCLQADMNLLYPGLINPARTFFAGFSDGGTFVNLLGSVTPNVAGVISHSGEIALPFRRANQIGAITKYPVLIVQGNSDHLVHPETATQLYSMYLQEKHLADISKLIMVPNWGHHWAKQKNEEMGGWLQSIGRAA